MNSWKGWWWSRPQSVLTEREQLEQRVRMRRGKLAYHIAEMERVAREVAEAEAALLAFAERERAEMREVAL